MGTDMYRPVFCVAVFSIAIIAIAAEESHDLNAGPVGEMSIQNSYSGSSALFLMKPWHSTTTLLKPDNPADGTRVTHSNSDQMIPLDPAFSTSQLRPIGKRSDK